MYIARDQVASRRLYPQALDADAYYTVNGERRTGADIMKNGFDMELQCTSQHFKWRCAMTILDKE